MLPGILLCHVLKYQHQASVVKLQIVTLAAKLLILCPTDHTLKLLTQYVFSLARYDLNYDIRDRARMLSSLLSGLSPSPINGIELEPRPGVVLRREQVKLVLFDGKSAAVDVDPIRADDENAMLGSLSLVTGRPMNIDAILPDWLENGVEPSLRDTEEAVPPQVAVPIALSSAQQRSKGVASPIILTPSGGSPAGSNSRSGSRGPWIDLDKFYADTEEVEEDDNQDGGDTDEEGDEEDDSESEEDHSGGEEEPEESEDGYDDDQMQEDDSERSKQEKHGLIPEPPS